MTNKEKDLRRTLKWLSAPPFVDAPFAVLAAILKARGHGDYVKQEMDAANKKEVYPMQTETFH